MSSPIAHTEGAPLVTGQSERRVRMVVALTAVTTAVELLVGYSANSLALLADGFHMATHVGVLGIAALAYWFARTQAAVRSFTFGTGKIHALAGYTNAAILTAVALIMIVKAIERIRSPEAIDIADSLPVAIFGLLVNLVSAYLLHPAHDHGDHERSAVGEHDKPHHHADHVHLDHNLRAAYFHVIADALTSVLAIAALCGVRFFGWTFLDPIAGLVGGLVVLRWGIRLCRDSARQLLDVTPSEDMALTIRRALEAAGAEVSQLHLWDVGPGRRCCMVAVVVDDPSTAPAYRELVHKLAQFEALTVEVNARAVAAPRIGETAGPPTA